MDCGELGGDAELISPAGILGRMFKSKENSRYTLRELQVHSPHVLFMAHITPIPSIVGDFSCPRWGKMR